MNLSYRCAKLEFKLAWLLVSMITMGAFFSLGMWQLQRYQDKQLWLETQAEQIIEGLFLEDFILYIDNKIKGSTPGYEVFQAFQLKNKTSPSQAVLISRGWIAQPKNSQDNYDRKKLPDIPLFNEKTTLHILHLKTRSIKSLPPKYGLTHFDLPQSTAPLSIRASRLDIPETQNFVNNHKQGLKLNLISDYYLSLPKTSAYQLTPLPDVKTWLNPHKHLGYAMQWFLFCLITVFLFIRFGIKINQNKP